jgi:predicted HicB family RNase H-like nuclease
MEKNLKKENQKEEDKKFIIRIPISMHYKLKLLALKQNVAMADLCREAIERLLKENEKYLR